MSGNWLFLTRDTFVGSSETPPASPPEISHLQVHPGQSIPTGRCLQPTEHLSSGSPNTGSSDRITGNPPPRVLPGQDQVKMTSHQPHSTRFLPGPGFWECVRLFPKLPGPCLETGNSHCPSLLSLVTSPPKFQGTQAMLLGSLG